MEELKNIFIINKIENKIVEYYLKNEISKTTLYEAKNCIEFHRNAEYKIYDLFNFEISNSKDLTNIYQIIRDNISSYVKNAEECEIVKMAIDSIAFDDGIINNPEEFF